MVTGVAGQGVGSLSFNSVEYPLNTDADTMIIVRENVKQILPTLEIQLPDYANLLSSNSPVNDGTTIDVIISDGVSNQTPNPFHFVAFGTPARQPLRTGNQYSISGVLNCVPLIRSSVNQAIVGTSTSVMQTAATNFKLAFKNNAATADSQTWRPGREHWGNFLNHVADHGYVDSNSFMSFSVSADSTLWYMNVPAIMTQNDVKAVIYHGTNNFGDSKPAYPCVQYKGVNRGGTTNNTNGYGLRMSQHDVTTGDVTKHTTVNAQKTGNLLDIGSSILQKISPVARILIPPINCGNVHTNYMAARHQNSRLGNVYSQNVYALVQGDTGLGLYDKVYFNATNENGLDNSTVGYYIVTGLVRILKGGLFYQKIELTNTGPSSNNAGLT